MPKEGVGGPGLPVGIGDDDLLQEQAQQEPEEQESPQPAIAYPGWEKSEEFKNLTETYDTAKTYWQAKHSKLIKCLKNYLSYVDRANYKYRSNLFIPKTNTAVRQMVARGTDAFQAVDRLCIIEPYIVGKIYPQNTTISDDRASACTDVMNLLLDMGHLRRSITRDFLYQFAIYGEVVGKLGWEYHEEGEDIIEEFPVLLPVSPFRYFPDPLSPSWEQDRYAHELMVMSEEAADSYAQALAPQLDKEALEKIKFNEDNASDSSYIGEAKDVVKESSGTQMGDTGYAVIIQSYAYLDPDGNGRKSLHRVFWGYTDKVLLGIQEYKYTKGKIPYIQGIFIPSVEGRGGIGIPEVLYYLQREYNFYRNQAADNTSLAANRLFIIDRTCGLDETAFLQSRPNRIAKADYMTEDHIKEFQFHPILGDLYQALGYLDQDIQGASGTNLLALGMEGPETAYATQNLSQQTQMAFDQFTTSFVQTFLEPALELMWGLVQQLISMPIVLRQEEGDPLVFTREMLQGRFKVKAGDVVEKGRRASRGQALTTLLAMLGQAGFPPQGMLPLALKVAELVGDVSHPEQYISIPPPAAPMPPPEEGGQPEGEAPGGVMGQPMNSEVPMPEMGGGDMRGSGQVMPGGNAQGPGGMA